MSDVKEKNKKTISKTTIILFIINLILLMLILYFQGYNEDKNICEKLSDFEIIYIIPMVFIVCMVSLFFSVINDLVEGVD